MSYEYNNALISEKEMQFLNYLESLIGKKLPKVDNVIREKIDKKGYSKIERKFGFSAEEGHVTGLGLCNNSQNSEINEKIFLNSLKNLPESIIELKNLKILDLSYNELSEIPDFINKLKLLTFLDLSHNSYHFIKISDLLGNLENLEYLDISGNAKLNSIPDTIGNLSKLKTLFISGNGSIDKLPDTLGNLKNLKNLLIERMGNLITLPESLGEINSLENFKIIRNGNLKTIPDNIGEKLQKLTEFSIIGNGKLENIPKSIGKMENLKILSITSNKSLQKLPESINNLKNLKILDLSRNNLKSLPDSIGDLSSLVSLNVSQNDLKELPNSIGLIKALRVLITDNNSWNSDFRTLLKKSTPEILNYLRKRASIFIFFSHAVQDYDEYKIKEICDVLEEHNEIYKVYYCERDMIGDIDEFMKKFVPKSQIMLFLGTKKSVYNSRDCEYEITEAIENGLEIIPIVGNDIDWPDLKKLRIERKLGIEYSKENFSQFKSNLLDHIVKIKRETNLFDKFEEQVTNLQQTMKSNFNNFLDSEEFLSLIEENHSKLFEINEKYDNDKIKRKEYLGKISKILFEL